MKDRVKIDDGYVIIARKIMDSSIWNADPEILKLFLYLICKARHKSKPKQFPNKIKVKRGELLTSYQNIINDNEFMKGKSVIRWSKGKLSRMLEKLEKKGTIKRIEDTHGTHIRVVHYDKYQNPENYKNIYSGTTPDKTVTPSERHGTTSEINNNVKKDNNAHNDNKTSTEDEGTPWSNEKFIKFDYESSKDVLEYQYDRFPKLVNKDEKSVQAGADTVRLMREQDGFTKKEIREMLKFGIKDSDFWYDKILSVSNLRKKSSKNDKKKIQNIYRDWMAAKEKGKNKKKKTTREIMKEAMDE